MVQCSVHPICNDKTSYNAVYTQSVIRFWMLIISTTVYGPNLNFPLPWLFWFFCLCANFERALRYISKQTSLITISSEIYKHASDWFDSRPIRYQNRTDRSTRKNLMSIIRNWRQPEKGELSFLVFLSQRKLKKIEQTKEWNRKETKGSYLSFLMKKNVVLFKRMFFHKVENEK